MMEKINVAELLKDCPKGMELNCTMYDNLYFNQIYDDDGCIYKIGCYTIVDEIRTTVNFTEFGTFTTHANSKCVIFPKGKTTWEGFHRPFMDGDVVCYLDSIAIFKEWGDAVLFRTYVTAYLHGDSTIDVAIPLCGRSIRREARLATEEEKQKLFKAIKDNGYEWDSDTKTLNKFKIKKGKWYVCIKKWYDEYDNEIFHKGYTYYSPENGKLMPSNSNVPYEILFYGDEYFREWTISDAKDGDVLYSYADDNEDDDGRYNNVFIFKEIIEYRVIAHCFIRVDKFSPEETFLVENTYPIRLATEEEKENLFQAIKDNGYNWNEKTKTLEKLQVTNKELQDLLNKYPHDAIVSIEYCNIRELKYIENKNLIVIE